MWYGYDFLKTEAKDMGTYTSSGKRPHNAYSNNQRVGIRRFGVVNILEK
jgi:hypothetical protein